MDLRAGTSGYSYKEWKGAFYPATLSARKMLNYYAQHFSCVEINYTFGSRVSAELLAGWRSQVGSTFQFALKAPQRITHFQRLNDPELPLIEFYDVIDSLGGAMAAVLYQLPPNFKKDLARLQAFLEVLPLNRRAAFEFRHESWFHSDVYKLLRKHKVALCYAEAEGDLAVPFVSTTDWGYVRLREYEYKDADLRKWLKKFKEQEWKDVYVFFKHEDEGNGPRLATRLIELAG